VIAGRTSSLPEIAGGAIEHVDQLDAETLGDAMVGLARDPDLRRHRSALGVDRAQRFSWNRAARETLGIYRQIVEHRALAPRAVETAAAAVAGSQQAGVR